MPKGDAKETRRGRGRPPREPRMLLLSGLPYDESWRGAHVPVLEGVLRDLERAVGRWEEYERLARAGGDPPEPELSMPLLLWLLQREPAYTPSADRLKLAAALQDRRHPLPDKFTIEEFVAVLGGEALAAGIACDFDTPYQAWFVYADLLLRDADIGAIIARVHPEKVALRSPRLTEAELRQHNADLARQERKRVKTKQKAFGYSAA